MMRVPETQAAPWFRYSAREMTALRSRLRPGCWRNISQTTAVLRYPGSRRRGQFRERAAILLPLDFGEYCFSFGLSSLSLARGADSEAGEGAAVAAGGCGWWSGAWG